MKKNKILLVVAMMAMTSGIFAQDAPRQNQITEEQQEQMESIREKHADKIDQLQQDIHYAFTKQNVLLSSKTIDEKAIYANIDEMGKLKADLKKERMAMRKEMKEVYPLQRQDFAPPFQQRPQQNRQDNAPNFGQNRPGNRQGMQNGKAQGGQQQGQGLNAEMKGQQQGNEPRGGRGHNMKSGNNNDVPHFNMSRGFGTFDMACLEIEDAQKEQLASIKKEHFWKIQETENELELLRTKYSDPENAEEGIEKIITLETKLAKQKMAMQIEQLNVLTEDQRIEIIENKGRGIRQGKGPDFCSRPFGS